MKSSVIRVVLSTVGQKFLMAATGVVLLLFLCGHLAGNMLVFVGPDALNAYAEFLHSKPAMVWGARSSLLFCLLVHVGAAIHLTLRNNAARPVGYKTFVYNETDYAARTMIWGGAIIALYIVYHLLHLTAGVCAPAGFDSRNVYGNVIAGFSRPDIAGVYIFAMLCLALHLFHGVWSLMQTLGVNHPEINCLRRPVSILIAVVLGAGYISIPVAVIAGIVR